MKVLIAGGWGEGGDFKLLLSFLFLTMKTAVLRTFVYAVKIK